MISGLRMQQVTWCRVTIQNFTDWYGCIACLETNIFEQRLIERVASYSTFFARRNWKTSRRVIVNAKLCWWAHGINESSNSERRHRTTYDVKYDYDLMLHSGVRRKFSWGDVYQWHMVVIWIWCSLLVTSQFSIIFMFLNQRFGEVCRHTTQILLHALPLFNVSWHCISTISSPGWDIGGKHTQSYDTAVHNCKNFRLRVEQFTIAKMTLR